MCYIVDVIMLGVCPDHLRRRGAGPRARRRVRQRVAPSPQAIPSWGYPSGGLYPAGHAATLSTPIAPVKSVATSMSAPVKSTPSTAASLNAAHLHFRERGLWRGVRHVAVKTLRLQDARQASEIGADGSLANLVRAERQQPGLGQVGSSSRPLISPPDGAAA